MLFGRPDLFVFFYVVSGRQKLKGRKMKKIKTKIRLTDEDLYYLNTVNEYGIMPHRLVHYLYEGLSYEQAFRRVNRRMANQHELLVVGRFIETTRKLSKKYYTLSPKGYNLLCERTKEMANEPMPYNMRGLHAVSTLERRYDISETACLVRGSGYGILRRDIGCKLPLTEEELNNMPRYPAPDTGEYFIPNHLLKRLPQFSHSNSSMTGLLVQGDQNFATYNFTRKQSIIWRTSIEVAQSYSKFEGQDMTGLILFYDSSNPTLEQMLDNRNKAINSNNRHNTAPTGLMRYLSPDELPCKHRYLVPDNETGRFILGECIRKNINNIDLMDKVLGESEGAQFRANAKKYTGIHGLDSNAHIHQIYLVPDHTDLQRLKSFSLLNQIPPSKIHVYCLESEIDYVEQYMGFEPGQLQITYMTLENMKQLFSGE